MQKLKAWGILAVGAFALAAGAIEVDGIAAKVGSDVVLKSSVFMELRRQGLDETRYSAILDEMIDRRLILKAAADSKMSIQDWVVDNRVNEIIAQNFGGDRNRLIEALSRQRQSFAEWRQRVQDDLVVSAMRWQTVDKNVTASPAAMKLEYSRHPERYAVRSRVTVSIILLKPEDAAKRDEVLAALKTKPFAEVAKAYSADAKAGEGGVWKDVDPNEQFRPEICDAIARLRCGEFSQWIDLDGWSFLLRKDTLTKAKRLSFAEAYDSIAANVREAEAKRLYDAWVGRLRAANFVKVY